MRMLVELGGPLEGSLQKEDELEEVEQLWRTCRYPSFSTFLFRVEFQWFLMELSVLRTKDSRVSLCLVSQPTTFRDAQ